MNNLEEIITALKTIITSVTGIGNIYSQIPIPKTEAELKDILLYEEEINTIGFTQAQRKVLKADSFGLETIERKFVFVYYYGINFQRETDSLIRTNIENILNAVNGNMSLNDTVNEHSKMDLTGLHITELYGIACHLAFMELTTFENQQNFI